MRALDDGRPMIERLVASRSVRATYASLVGHIAAFVLLALMVIQPPPADRPLALRLALEEPASQDALEAAVDLLPEAAAARLGAGTVDGDGPAGAAAAGPPPVDEAANPAAAVAASASPQEAADAVEPPPAAAQSATEPTVAAAVKEPATAPGDGSPSRRNDIFGGRRGAARGAGVAARGGSAASEAAVARGLEWLARHQAADGSWRFDLSGCRCDGACGQPGTVASTTAATGIALLPFLGAGQTHEEGEHRETVTRGLYYLMSRMRATPRGGDLSEGTMYGHGVATLALAEALGMTADRMLVPYVRDGVRFIETAQDLHGGGWRYLPGQAGDTTVTAWQLAALKSAALAGVAVPSPTLDGVCRFLDRVQVRSGEGYGYLAPQDRSCTSAIGLLCRVYTAWPEEAAIDRGLARLAKPGPDREAVYQNFYLSQALLLRNHPAWPRWNRRNRDQLVARQAQAGHEAGSWSFADPDTAPGGRLGHTALAILTLEVYYRLLPIFSADAAEQRW
ncbi:MAG: prenyltransferase/squalene oxidase repeat-containing protein [Planctomycetota bacterium]